MEKKPFKLTDETSQAAPQVEQKEREYKWNFPLNNFGQINGIADSGVETFRSTPIKSLAREICQNSIDANLDSSLPTKVQFKTFTISPTQIPDGPNLKTAFQKSLEFWARQKADKAKDFFKKGLTEFNKTSIPCLRISDYNTTGLTGSKAEYNSPWCNLTKSSGASDKSGSTGGSFGIGKAAPFACSNFRTVFYSTADVEKVCAYQGVARITSFRIRKNQITQGIGFYGDRKNTPVFQQFSLDPAYQRNAEDTGTDIFILGFNGTSGWETQLITSILDGFLYTLHLGRLVVEVNDILISKETLPELIEKYKNQCKEHAEEYYKVLTSDEAREFTKELAYNPFIKGKLTLWLLFNNDFHRRIAMIRMPGMKIKDKRFTANVQFTGVLFIEDSSLSQYLRRLENPQHLEWEIERVDDRTVASGVLNAINRFIKECLSSMMTEGSEEALDPEVGDFLTLPLENEGRKNQDRMESITNKIKALNLNPPRFISSPTGTESGFSGKTSVDDPDGDLKIPDTPGFGSREAKGKHRRKKKGQGDFPSEGKGNHPLDHPKSYSPIAPMYVRSSIISKTAGTYQIIFIPNDYAYKGYMDIFMSAEAQKYEAPIKEVQSITNPGLKVKGNRISHLSFTKKEPVIIDIVLDYHDYCSMEIMAYGNKI